MVVARQLRIEFPGAVYYLANRSDGGKVLFKGAEDRELFLATLAEACRKTGWQVLAYCLLPDQFHLVLETPQANLVTGMKWLLGTYTIKFNRRHQAIGHLFAGRYRSVLVDAKSPDCVAAICHYTHLCAACLGRLDEQVALKELPGNSLGFYLQPAAQRPSWLITAALFRSLNLADDAAGQAQLELAAEQLRANPPSALWRQIRRGWCFGGADFRKNLLERIARAGPNSAAPHREFSREQAELLVQEELNRLGWTDADLCERAKGDPQKIRIARRVRQETTVSLRWVAQRLHLGSWTHAANCLYRKDFVPSAKPATKPARRPRAAKVKPVAAKSTSPKSLSEVPPSSEPPITPPAGGFMDELPVYCL